MSGYRPGLQDFHDLSDLLLFTRIAGSVNCRTDLPIEGSDNRIDESLSRLVYAGLVGVIEPSTDHVMGVRRVTFTEIGYEMLAHLLKVYRQE